MNARVAMSWPDVVAMAEATDPMPNNTKPTCSAPRRPNLSPNAPAVSRSPAKTSV